jgi:hypothetical protein
MASVPVRAWLDDASVALVSREDPGNGDSLALKVTYPGDYTARVGAHTADCKPNDGKATVAMGVDTIGENVTRGLNPLDPPTPYF